MAEYKFSDFSESTSPSLGDQLVGLKSGDNARFTLSTLSDFFQSQLSVVSPLPTGSPAKVMYFDPDTNKWGASTSVNTDGFVVSIGNTEPYDNTLLNIENNNGSYTSLINAYSKNSLDVVTKVLNYSQYGILHIAEGSVPANIDNEDRSSDYGLYVEKGIVAGNSVFLDNDNGSKLRFGQINATTGEFTDRSIIKSQSNVLISVSPLHYNYIGSETATNLVTKIGANGPTNMKKFDIGSANDIQNWTLFSGSATSHGSIWGMSEIVGLVPYIGKVTIGGRSGGDYLSISNSSDPSAMTASNLILHVDEDEKIYMRLPTTAGGTPSGTMLQLWNDGGVLKLS